MAKKLSWQVTVTTAGTAVQGDSTGSGWYVIKADPANTGKGYVGNDGSDDVSATTGFILDAGEQIPMLLESLSDVWFDTAVNGEKFVITVMELPLHAAMFNLS